MDDTTDQPRPRARINSVDLLRGIVMMVMLLDHTREFVHHGALVSDPSNLSDTTTLLFFTRWVTHFCAPAFVFLSGVSIYLQKMNGKSNAILSRFLWTRGLWLIFLEFTVVRFLIVFNLDYSFFGMAQVIWVIGVSMIVMSAMIYLPAWVSAAVGLSMIALHNLLDPLSLPPNIAFASAPPPDQAQAVWIILHQPGIVPIFDGASRIFFAYPLIPWIGVMMAGYAAGSVFRKDRPTRQMLLFAVGAAAIVLFAALRATNLYGDPQPWSEQPAGAVFTFLSFLNTAKYPPSLLFLLMTLGPSLLVLAAADGLEGRSAWQRVVITFGRVPLFFYVLQWAWAHLAGLTLNAMAGVDVSYLFKGILEMGASAPPDHGFSIWTVYACWLVGLAVIYPFCVWWDGLKRRRAHWTLSYL